MADDPKSAKEPAVKKKPVDKTNTLLFRFARKLGRTARVLKVGSTWFVKKSGSAIPQAAQRVGKGVRTLESRRKAAEPEEEAPALAEEEEAAAGITADVEAAVQAAAEEPEEEEAAEDVSADVEAAMKAAEEASKE